MSETTDIAGGAASGDRRRLEVERALAGDALLEAMSDPIRRYLFQPDFESR